MRARTFSALVWAYDACRQLLHELRRDEGDAETIAPSLGVPELPDDEVTDAPSPREPTPQDSPQAAALATLPNRGSIGCTAVRADLRSRPPR